MLRKAILLFFTLSCLLCFAQHDSTSPNRCITLIDENDFYMGTDMYYTGGSMYGAILPALRKWPVMKLLPHLSNSVSEYGLSLNQTCFTPKSLHSDSILKGDRPFAGGLFIDNFSESAREDKQERLYTELDLGVIGSCSYCEEIQKDIHRWLSEWQPHGWQYQLSNAPYVNYRLRFEKGFINHHAFVLSGFSEVNAGTVYDNLSFGGNLYFGKMQPHFSITHNKAFQFYGLVKGWAKIVGYNTTLEGNLFTTDVYTLPSSAIEPIVLYWSYGFAISYRSIALEYSSIYLTREIAAGLPHAWGHASLFIYF